MASGLQGPGYTSCAIFSVAGGVQGQLSKWVLSLVGLDRLPSLASPLHAVLGGLVWPLRAAPGDLLHHIMVSGREMGLQDWGAGVTAWGGVHCQGLFIWESLLQLGWEEPVKMGQVREGETGESGRGSVWQTLR